VASLIGASVNGKPTVSKTVTAGSSPAAPAVSRESLIGRMNIFKKSVNFLKEVKIELGKVSWSTREELIGSTFVVIVITGILAAFIGVIDLFLSKALSMLFR
jgi:preprotein translocase subunit SecE